MLDESTCFFPVGSVQSHEIVEYFSLEYFLSQCREKRSIEKSIALDFFQIDNPVAYFTFVVPILVAANLLSGFCLCEATPKGMF